MNKSHPAGKDAQRSRSAIPAASIRQSLLESEDFNEDDDALELAALPDDAEDWPELESDARDVESEIDLLLKGGAYR